MRILNFPHNFVLSHHYLAFFSIFSMEEMHIIINGESSHEDDHIYTYELSNSISNSQTNIDRSDSFGEAEANQVNIEGYIIKHSRQIH